MVDCFRQQKLLIITFSSAHNFPVINQSQPLIIGHILASVVMRNTKCHSGDRDKK